MPEFSDIAPNMEALTKKQRSVAEFILERPEHAAGLTLKQMSIESGASEVSVLRMCTALGFDGYSELRQALMRYTQSAFRTVRAAEGIPQALSQKLRGVCALDMNNLTDMIDGLDEAKLFESARGLLAANEVYIFAHDASNIFSEYLSYRLSFLRIKATCVKMGDVDTLQTVLARLTARDYAILISFPPYHKPISGVADYCRYRGVSIMTITDSEASPAAAGEGNVFICRTAAKYFYNSQVATVSFINVLASCAAIAMGSRFDEILSAERDVEDFMRGGYSAQEG